MAILTTTITLILTHQTGQRQVLNHSQTNSHVEGQPNRFCVCCFVHLCIALCKILVGWSLCCYILYIISLYISVCFITLVFRFKSDIQEVGFQSSCPNSALSADFPWTWKPKHSVLSTRFLCRVQCMRTSLLLVRQCTRPRDEGSAFTIHIMCADYRTFVPRPRYMNCTHCGR